MRRLNHRMIQLGMGMVFCLTGCGARHESESISSVPRQQAESLNAEHSRFETGADPAFTAQTHFAAAQLAESQGAAQNAVEQYRAALAVDPHHLPSLYRLGVILTQMRSYPEAVTVWKEYVRQSNGDATAYGNLGFCHELAGQLSEAEAAYKQGIAKDPKNSLCHTNYGLMLARTQRTEEAIVQLRAVLSDAQVHYNLGSVHEQLGRREEARAEYLKALELDPKMADAKSRLAGLK